MLRPRRYLYGLEKMYNYVLNGIQGKQEYVWNLDIYFISPLTTQERFSAKNVIAYLRNSQQDNGFLIDKILST